MTKNIWVECKKWLWFLYEMTYIKKVQKIRNERSERKRRKENDLLHFSLNEKLLVIIVGTLFATLSSSDYHLNGFSQNHQFFFSLFFVVAWKWEKNCDSLLFRLLFSAIVVLGRKSKRNEQEKCILSKWEWKMLFQVSSIYFILFWSTLFFCKNALLCIVPRKCNAVPFPNGQTS